MKNIQKTLLIFALFISELIQASDISVNINRDFLSALFSEFSYPASINIPLDREFKTVPNIGRYRFKKMSLNINYKPDIIIQRNIELDQVSITLNGVAEICIKKCRDLPFSIANAKLGKIQITPMSIGTKHFYQKIIFLATYKDSFKIPKNILPHWAPLEHLENSVNHYIQQPFNLFEFDLTNMIKEQIKIEQADKKSILSFNNTHISGNSEGLTIGFNYEMLQPRLKEITINVKSTQNLQEYLNEYQSNFGNTIGGRFNSWSIFATRGTQYAEGEGKVLNAGDRSKRGFIAEGDIRRNFQNHNSKIPKLPILLYGPIHGKLETLKLGMGLAGWPGFHLQDELFVIKNINISAKRFDGYDNIVNKVLYGLSRPREMINGNEGVKHLEDLLNSYHIKMIGNNKNNQLQGYNGNDILTGGSGRDTFIFKPYGDGLNFGNDIITDYQVGEVIKIASALNNSAYTTYEVQGNTVIDFGSAGTITLTGVTNFDANAVTVTIVY